MADVFHLGLTRDMLQGATIAILPGDPGRVERIANHFDNPTFLASTREFTSYLGFADGKPVVVCSTGIGGPSVSITVEELSQLGVDTFIRAGTTGAIQPGIAVGDVVVTNAAVRLDGASFHFAPSEFPAVSNFQVTRALVDVTIEAGQDPHVGVTASADTFYPGQERYDTTSGFVVKRFRGSMQEWQDLGVMNYEMETATLFTQCSTQGLRAGCLSGVLVNRLEQEMPDKETIAAVEENAITLVAAAVRKLLA